LERNLRENGASTADIAFMFRDFDETRSTRRVELNAMTSPQFVEFVERKLRENGIEKIIPDEDLLAEVYRGMGRGRRLAEAVGKLDQITAGETPADLDQLVRTPPCDGTLQLQRSLRMGRAPNAADYVTHEMGA
jgi:hypothetical protein